MLQNLNRATVLEQAPLGFTFQKRALITRLTISDLMNIIILYSKWNRYNRRKTHLSKARHSSWTNPCVTHQAEEACQSDFPTPYISIFMMNVSLFLSCYVFLSSKLVKDIYQCAAEVKDTSKKVGDIPFHIQPSACHQCYAVKGRNN